jgi:NAD(P)-dependent dehydrogenase (short-subunit alcohol dehydrogenase family)
LGVDQVSKLTNKVTLVTGSGRGFGRAIALAFAKEGAQVVSVARPSPQDLVELQSLEKTIETMGGVVLTIPTDLTKDTEIQNMKAKVLERFGRCDVLVNNAGVSMWKTIDELTVKDWDLSVSVNLRAPFILAKEFFEIMKNQGGGSIINISSRAAEIGFFAELELCPSKFAIEGFTQCLALELNQYNIAANSIHPSAPPGKRLKPTGLTLTEAKGLPKEVTNQYADDEEMITCFGDAWTFLAVQDAAGVTGQRFRLHKLAEFLSKNGWDAAVNKWKGKLTEAVYTPYDWPKKIRYQTPGGGYTELEFD